MSELATPVESITPARDVAYDVRDAIEVRDAGDEGAPPVLHGHFAVFDRWTEINGWEGNFLERIAPGALKKTLEENAGRVRVTLNHGADPMLGDKPLGTVSRMEEDETGAAYEVDLFRGIPDLVMDGLRAGQYGASFRFKVIREETDDRPKASARNPGRLPERTIKELHLYEFGPVTFPAYAQATAMVRTARDPAPPAPDAAPTGTSEEGRRDEQEPRAPASEATPRTPRKDYLTGGSPSWRL